MKDAPATLLPARLVIPPTQDTSDRFYAMDVYLVFQRGREYVWTELRAVMN